MNRAFLLALSAAACTSVAAEPPPHQAEIGGWAKAAHYKLWSPRACPGIETRHFGAMGAMCWSAKSQVEQRPKSRLYPRVTIQLATYRDDDAAAARIARFREVPKSLAGEGGKTYPLRAGFRVGTRVIIVTTDAYAFERDAYRAAAELATAVGGTDLVCWQSCDSI